MVKPRLGQGLLDGAAKGRQPIGDASSVAAASLSA